MGYQKNMSILPYHSKRGLYLMDVSRGNTCGSALISTTKGRQFPPHQEGTKRPPGARTVELLTSLGLSREKRAVGLWWEDKRALHTLKTSASRTFQRSMLQAIHLDFGRKQDPPHRLPHPPTTQLPRGPLLPARYKQMSGGKRQAESEGEKYQSVGQVVDLGYPMKLGTHRSQTETKFYKG